MGRAAARRRRPGRARARLVRLRGRDGRPPAAGAGADARAVDGVGGAGRAHRPARRVPRARLGEAAARGARAGVVIVVPLAPAPVDPASRRTAAARDGYLYVPGLVAAAALDALRAVVDGALVRRGWLHD